MHICSTLLPTVSLYYPLGTTPSVCLTQDLPPELEADILLLGCGDARNILCTCFADHARKIDVTCCDIEPMIHARNVLLFTLLIDDESNLNFERIWNIYFNWKIDENTLELLESQIKKLLSLSESIDQWHGSVHGSFIRFCDEKSLFCVRRYWSGFMSEGLTSSQNKDRLNQLQAAIDRAKDKREKLRLKPDGMGYRSTFPTSTNSDPWADLSKVTEHWWDCGEAPSSKSSTQEPTHLNPAFLYSPDNQLTMFAGTSPVGGIPLSTAYASISKESPFFLTAKSPLFTEHLVDCAKHIFGQWGIAFRKSMANGSVIRIFSGDALAFCLTLRNCQLTGSTTMNLFRHNLTCSPLILHHSNYGRSTANAAPLSFNVVDTSDLIDYLGPLNLLVVVSDLLKFHVSSCLYTELLSLFDADPIIRLNKLFGVDARSMAFFLGLVLPDLFINATSSIEEYRCLDKLTKFKFSRNPKVLARSRLRWKRSAECLTSINSQSVQVEAKELAKFLIQVHNAMFRKDKILDSSSNNPVDEIDAAERYKLDYRPYSLTSYAFLLKSFKAKVVSKWNECMKEIWDGVHKYLRDIFEEDLSLSLDILGVQRQGCHKADIEDMNNPIVASVLSKSDVLLQQLCVTVRVRRKYLERITKTERTLAIICSLESEEEAFPFSSVHVAFGKWHERTEEKDSHPYVEEDEAQQWGTSDMFLSFFVPTSLLTHLDDWSESDFLVRCGVKASLSNHEVNDVYFCTEKISSKNVFITKFMPGMSELPIFNIINDRQDVATLGTLSVRISSDGSKIESMARRIPLQSEAAKSEAAKNKVALKTQAAKVKFKSPLTAVVRIPGLSELKLEFPVPVSVSKYTVKVSSSYVEVESTFFDPSEEDDPSFLFPCFLMNVPKGSVPVPWTSTRVDLDTMPCLDVKDSQKLSWLLSYNLQMLTERETRIVAAKTIYDYRAAHKTALEYLFTVFCGAEGMRKNFFTVDVVNARVKILILPSCVRLDLTNNTIVLDSAVVFLTTAARDDPIVNQFLLEITSMAGSIEVKEAEYLVWKAMMPALVERCRTWEHSSKCKYIKASEVPLPCGKSPICSCGIGKFPANYLEDKIEKISTLRYILDHYATRVAISPIFSAQFVEDCNLGNFINERCEHCHSLKRKNAVADDERLLTCARCKKVFYCSADCQKLDWKKHKPICFVE